MHPRGRGENNDYSQPRRVRRGVGHRPRHRCQVRPAPLTRKAKMAAGRTPFGMIKGLDYDKAGSKNYLYRGFAF